jgi:hypothetical protein
MISNPTIPATPRSMAASLTSLMKAAKSEMTVSPAAPIAKPLVTALTVLPA